MQALTPPLTLLQEAIAGCTILRSFRPDPPNHESPAPSQGSEENVRPMDREDRQTVFNSDGLYGSCFTGSSPIQKKSQVKKLLAGSRKPNPREMKVRTSDEEWRPEQLSNGNYRQVLSLSLCLGPYLILGATTSARTGITADISGTFTSVTLSDLLNQLQLQGRAEEPATASKVKGSIETRSQNSKENYTYHLLIWYFRRCLYLTRFQATQPR